MERWKDTALIFCEQFETQKDRFNKKQASQDEKEISSIARRPFEVNLTKKPSKFCDSFFFWIFSSSASSRGTLKVLQFTDIFLISTLVHFLVGIYFKRHFFRFVSFWWSWLRSKRDENGTKALLPRNFLSKVIGNKKFLSIRCLEVEFASLRTDQFNGCLRFRRFWGCQGL